MGRYFIHIAFYSAYFYGLHTLPGLPTIHQTLESAMLTLIWQKGVMFGVCLHCNHEP